MTSASRHAGLPQISRPVRLFAAWALVLGMAVVVPAAPPGFGAGMAAAKGGTESLADLADKVVDAVVNISASQVTEQKQAGAAPKLPPGTPFEELFEDLFKRQLQGQNGKGPAPDVPRARRSNSLGSGFVIDPSGIVITNNHVIEGANEITVILTDGRKLKAEVVGKDAKVDVAVLQVKPDAPLKAVPFGDSDKMRVGDAVMAVGNPFGLGGTVTSGIVSARHRNIDSGPYDNYIQTDASINKGNSGGPLFNMAGEVIGINTAILSPSGGSIGIGFATPSGTVMPVIDQLRQFHEVRRGWLGVRIQNVDQAIADSLSLGTPRGALVAGIDDKGPAKPAGLRAGDVVVSFDGKPVAQARDLPVIVASTPVGKDVPVVIVRDGKEETVTVKLGQLAETEAVADADPSNDRTAPPAATASELGMTLSILTDEQRKKFSVKDNVKGVAVTDVDPGSPAGSKGVKAGDVLTEVNQEPVAAPADVTAKLKAARDAGKKTVLMLVANGQGDVRFVAVTLD